MSMPVLRRRALRAMTLMLSLLGLMPVRASAVDGSFHRGQGLGPVQLAVVINSADPLSVAIGEYYVQQRRIPAGNVARVAFDHARRELPVEEFAKLKAAIDAQLPSSVQAYALTWAEPYRVGCMSITSAFAFGFDARFCADSCVATRLSPYFDSGSSEPYADLHLRPAMSVAAASFEQARALIDRGVRADASTPTGTAYLVTSDGGPRDVRAYGYPDAQMLAGDRVKVQIIHAIALENRSDVMFYFIGAVKVPALSTNQFLPGAVADHLTSAGGALTDSSQMSSLRWLEAGATGSYGTVIEPCNFTAKFPNPGLLMHHYLAGETLIEAYWKSVAMPGQGIFIGEPLARPFRSVTALAVSH